MISLRGADAMSASLSAEKVNPKKIILSGILKTAVNGR